MAGLQRSEVSFRRQGSSGFVWDDRFLSGELNQEGKPKQDQQNLDDNRDQHASRNIQPIKTVERNQSNGCGGRGRGYRTGRVSPAVDPPSPKVSACGFCTGFGKSSKNISTKKPAKRASR